MLLSEETKRKIYEMIITHEKETGKEPISVTVPMPRIEVRGIPIHFMNGSKYYFTADKNTVFHHKWNEAEGNTSL